LPLVGQGCPQISFRKNSDSPHDFKKTARRGFTPKKRYHRLVAEHMNSSDPLSAGLKALPDKISSFASTQAAWRFYQNESVSLPKLQEPLTAAAHKGIREYCSL
jgi:hypothetical protein